MAILVTGGSGFIGSNLTRHLQATGYKDLVLLLRKPFEQADLPVIMDDGNTDNLINSFRTYNIHGVIHLASLFLSQHKTSDIDNLIISNVLLGTRLCEAAHKTGCRWFINTSTFFQHYENKEYEPVSLYSATKKAFEDILKFYSDVCGLRSTSLHLFDSYGAGDKRPKLIKLLKEKAEAGEKLAMSPGQQRINLIHVDDIVEAYRLLVGLVESSAHLETGYSITASETLTLRELVQLYERILGKAISIEWGKTPYRPREIMDPVAIHPLVPGWVQKISLSTGLESLN